MCPKAPIEAKKKGSIANKTPPITTRQNHLR